MRIFITGGTGFIGTHAVRELRRRKHDIKILEDDLGTPTTWHSDVKRFKPQVAIHLAWEGLPKYDFATSMKNFTYSMDLYHFLADIGCARVITTGSWWEHEKIPPNTFTAAKHAIRLLGTALGEEKNMNFIWARLAYVYGPGQRPTSLIPSVLEAARQGKKPVLKNPNARHDFIHVHEVARHIADLATKKNTKSGTYDIASGRMRTVKNFVAYILEHGI